MEQTVFYLRIRAFQWNTDSTGSHESVLQAHGRDIHTVSGGIYISSGGTVLIIKDRIELNNGGTIVDKVSAEIDGVPAANSEFTGTWTQTGNTYNVHLTKEKDKLEGTTKDVDINGSATLSADGKTLTAGQKQEGIEWYYVYTKQWFLLRLIDTRQGFDSAFFVALQWFIKKF